MITANRKPAGQAEESGLAEDTLESVVGET